jgi:hypothetical protein
MFTAAVPSHRAYANAFDTVLYELICLTQQFMCQGGDFTRGKYSLRVILTLFKIVITACCLSAI